jgi:hypothetical protein
MAEADWEQLGEAAKKKKTRATFVGESKRTYMNAKRSNYVRAFRTDAQERKREWHKQVKRRENRRMMPQTSPPPQPVEEEIRSRLTQVWWLENEISAVHHWFKSELSALKEEMAVMKNVGTHQHALLAPDGESVRMIPIRKGMPMSPAGTMALSAVAMVIPCVKGGENCFEDESEWKTIMEDHTYEDIRRDNT